MLVQFANNAKSTLAADITAVATSIAIQTGEGSRFPSASVASGKYYRATLANSLNQLEIVYVTNLTTDTFTVARGQEGTVARAYTAGDKFELRATAAGFQDIVKEPVVAKSALFTVSATDDLAKTFANTGTFTVTLPAAASAGNGFWFNIRSVSGTSTIDPNGAETINGSATFAVAAGESYRVVCDGSGWICIGNAAGVGDFKADGSVPMTGSLTLGGAGTGIVFEGTTADAFETTLVAGEPTADQTVTMPNATTTLAGLAVTETFTAPQRGTITTDNDLSFDLNVTNFFVCTPTAGGALTFTNIATGQGGTIKLVNGSNYAITAAANTKVTSTFLATISATGTHLIYYFADGTNVYCSTPGAFV